MLRGLLLVSSLLLVALPATARAQLVVTTTEAHSPTHGGTSAALAARLHVENPSDAAVELRVDALELTDETGNTQRLTGVRLRARGRARTAITVPAHASLDVDIEVPARARVEIAYHVAYRQALVLRVGGRPERLERPGAFEFRAPRVR